MQETALPSPHGPRNGHLGVLLSEEQPCRWPLTVHHAPAADTWGGKVSEISQHSSASAFQKSEDLRPTDITQPHQQTVDPGHHLF